LASYRLPGNFFSWKDWSSARSLSVNPEGLARRYDLLDDTWIGKPAAVIPDCAACTFQNFEQAL
jgi:hypothetical protein